jgi:PKD repeat protein
MAVLVTAGILLGGGCKDKKYYGAVVKEAPEVNNPPSIGAIPDQTVIAGATFALDVASVGNVADDHDAIGDLVFQVVSGGGSFADSTYLNTFAVGANVVQFRILDTGGESANASFTVNAYDLPVADFSADETTGTGSLTVTFTDESAGDPTEWEWDFGDGSTSASQNPTHAYNTPGVYTVTLKITNQVGTDEYVRTDYITVNIVPVPPVAGFTVNSLAFNSIPALATFTDTSTGNPISWAWDFNADGVFDSYVQNPIHTFTTAGYHTVKLVVANAAGSSFTTKQIFAATQAWYVNVNTGNDANDGSTPGTAFKTIDWAVDENPLLGEGHIIWLADGIYYESNLYLPEEFHIYIASQSGNPARWSNPC